LIGVFFYNIRVGGLARPREVERDAPLVSPIEKVPIPRLEVTSSFQRGNSKKVAEDHLDGRRPSR